MSFICNTFHRYSVRLTSAALCLLMALASCGGRSSTSVTRIEGRIDGLGNDTLYLYGADALYDRVDTIVAQSDRFSTDLTAVDTLICTWLQMPDGREYPLFIGPGERVKVLGNLAEPDSTSLLTHRANAEAGIVPESATDTLAPATPLIRPLPLRLQVTGTPPNDELTTFYLSVDSLPQHTDSILQAHAEAFIRSHPASLASISVLAHFFVEVAEPDAERIESVASSMIGDIKDRPFVEELLGKLTEAGKAAQGKNASNFTLTGPEGQKVSRTDFKDRYLLVHFWASYDSLSRARLDMYRRLYRAEKSNKYLAILGVSLDIDRNDWLAAVEADTLVWDQAVDLAGWNAAIVSQLALQTLPANFLLNVSGRIEGRDLSEQELRDKIADLTLRRQEQEERKLKAEQNKKKREAKKKK